MRDRPTVFLYIDPLGANVRICDEVCRITVCLVGGARYEDGNVRAAREGTVDARGVGPSGGYRSQYAVESPGKRHAYPPKWGAVWLGR